ncbi:uncharacterized protein BDW47DRAFT_102896 [Aspergillus candidus]|uniref:Uncharacterized protein n=1 Tax=Aspergillus candidus TaxID=41067 RepID=A0A2I2FGC7_ASPCN|nr:hypothetical protein BDW47DRAFT_102896 [Aspergillus candidus]PLB39674.1 hypothetical protein BDW47DRAFT_102896 [Aspergillus candidus]
MISFIQLGEFRLSYFRSVKEGGSELIVVVDRIPFRAMKTRNDDILNEQMTRMTDTFDHEVYLVCQYCSCSKLNLSTLFSTASIFRSHSSHSKLINLIKNSRKKHIKNIIPIYHTLKRKERKKERKKNKNAIHPKENMPSVHLASPTSQKSPILRRSGTSARYLLGGG